MHSTIMHKTDTEFNLKDCIMARIRFLKQLSDIFTP